jgi:hypothetical protein
VKIDGGGPIEELPRGDASAFAVRYAWSDADQGERDQLELGVADGQRLGCSDPDDDVLGWTLPVGFITGGSHRVFALTAQLVHESHCGSGPREDGWAGEAPDDPIIGYICVR